MTESNCELSLNRRCSSPQHKIESHTSVNAKISSMSSSCRICLSRILDPASLTCGHKFCEQCLLKYWHAGDKPDFIICPLCRAYAIDVDFTKKAERSSTDFRKTFNALEGIDESEGTVVNTTNNARIICIKMSILLPVMYYLLKFLQMPLTNMLTFLQLKLRLLL